MKWRAHWLWSSNSRIQLWSPFCYLLVERLYKVELIPPSSVLSLLPTSFAIRPTCCTSIFVYVSTLLDFGVLWSRHCVLFSGAESTIASRPWLPRLKSDSCHLVTIWLWASCLLSPCLSFLLCKKEIIIVPTSPCCYED